MKKVLIISYYWPPAGGPGVQRILKFVKYIGDFGWKPIILTVKDGEYPAIDHSLEKEVPSDVTVYRTNSREVFKVFKMLKGQKPTTKLSTNVLTSKPKGFVDKLARWVRYNMFIPDARVGWVRKGISTGKQIIDQHKPDLLFCTSPPHSAQLIARQLHQYSGIPWIADFRDAWTDAFWLTDLKKYPSAFARNLKLEKTVLKECTALITVSNQYAKMLDKVDRKDTIIIPNGYDETDFRHVQKPRSAFTIVYTGSLSARQNPSHFIDALEKIAEEGVLFVFNLWGSIDEVFRHRMEKGVLGKCCKFHSYAPHAEITYHMCNADLLLFMTPKGASEGMIPLKLYEYLATGNFILGIGDPGNDAAKVLASCSGGHFLSYSEDPYAILKERLTAWKNNERHQSNKAAIEKFSRRELTKQLTDVFNNYV